MPRRISQILIALLLILSLCSCELLSSQPVMLVDAKEPQSESTMVEHDKPAKRLVVLHTNDTHGRVVGSDEIVGMSAISALKAKHQQDEEAIVLLIDAGDTFHGTPFATIDKGESVKELMVAAGYDAMALGNHDFNYGFEHVRALVEDMEFMAYSANTLELLSGRNALPSSSILKQQGITIGLFGLTTPETAYKTSPNNVEKLAFADPIATAKKQVESLKENGAEYIIAISHIGLDPSAGVTSEDIASQVAGIDLIIDGHSHTYLEQGKQVADTLIVSSGQYMQAVGVVTVDLSTKQATATQVTSQDANEQKLADPNVDKIIDEITKQQDALLSVEVAKTDVRLEGARELVRTSETNLGNLLADAMRAETKADVAITNGGGIRDSIEIGIITRGDIVSVVPFGNFVVTKQIKGSVLREMLEHALAQYPESSGAFPQVSGISVVFDPNLPAGKRISEVMIVDKKLDPEQTYLLATNDFLAAGGDGFTMLSPLATINEFGALEEVLTDYLNRVSLAENSIYAKNDKRIVVEVISVYTVLANDSLVTIALARYGDGDLWREIYDANRDIIKSPNHIQVGWQLVLP